MKRLLAWLAFFALVGLAAQACEAAYGKTPDRIRIVVEQVGDSARIIVSWSPSQVGTHAIARYLTRLSNPGNEAGTPLRMGQTTATVDTLYHPWSTPGVFFRVGVQAEDTQGNVSICAADGPTTCIDGYNWSAAFELVQPLIPPGLPGEPSVAIDTSDIIALDMFRIVPDSMALVEGFGTAVLEGRFFARGMLVACAKALISENPISVVGVGICDDPVVYTDSLYDPRNFDFTTADELISGLEWLINQR